MSKIGNKKGRHVEHNININLDEDEEIERIKAESLKDVQPLPEAVLQVSLEAVPTEDITVKEN